MACEEQIQKLTEIDGTWNTWRKETNLECPDLSGADLRQSRLSGLDLSGADLTESNLCKADLRCADLKYADLRGAKLRGTLLNGADFRGAQLNSADMSQAILVTANFYGADLDKTLFKEAILCQTTFAFTSLKTAIGLETCFHGGPSVLDYQTLADSGTLPVEFLRGCGLSDIFIEYLPSLFGHPVKFYQCFISYATQDEGFASRLHNDFQKKGIRCWKWDVNARTGRRLIGEIDTAIRVCDKLILVASESSLTSPIVLREIERALNQEDERMRRKVEEKSTQDCDVLFPVRLDDYIFKGWEHERKADVTNKFVADARGWHLDDKTYSLVLTKLTQDLRNDARNPGISTL